MRGGTDVLRPGRGQRKHSPGEANLPEVNRSHFLWRRKVEEQRKVEYQQHCGVLGVNGLLILHKLVKGFC